MPALVCASVLFIAESHPVFTLMLLSFVFVFKLLIIFFRCLFAFCCILRAVLISLSLQVSAFLRFLQFVVHHVMLLLGTAAKVVRVVRRYVQDVGRLPLDRRRRMYRRAVNRPIPRPPVRRRLITSDRRCCVCMSREKNVLLRSCNHICLCEACFRVVMNADQPRCPVYRAVIMSYVNVFL